MSGTVNGNGTARLQSILRRINDEIAERAGGNPTAAFVCECGDRSCVEAVELPVGLYGQLRLVPNRFAVRPEHVETPAERLVENGRSYAIVERLGRGRDVRAAG